MSSSLFKRKGEEPKQLNEEILSTVKKILSQHLSVAESKLNPDSILLEDLGVDSLDVIELVMALEEEYSIEIPDEDAEKLLTVREVVEYLEARIEKEENS